MTTIQYTPYEEINQLQTDIMRFVVTWVQEKKIPVPHQEVLKAMRVKNVHDFTTVNAVSALLRKGYIRRAYTSSNKTFYVQLRNL